MAKRKVGKSAGKLPAKSKTFKEAVAETPEIAHCFKPGLQALGQYSTLIKAADPKLICGSVELDECVRLLYSQDNRWDFIICYDTRIYYIEVHSANTGEVSTMINKYHWLRTWLNEKAPEIKALNAPQPFHWIQSGRFDILKNSKQYRQLQQLNLLPKKELKLP